MVNDVFHLDLHVSKRYLFFLNYDYTKKQDIKLKVDLKTQIFKVVVLGKNYL